MEIATFPALYAPPVANVRVFEDDDRQARPI
jgi:hypothetical protein